MHANHASDRATPRGVRRPWAPRFTAARFGVGALALTLALACLAPAPAGAAPAPAPAADAAATRDALRAKAGELVNLAGSGRIDEMLQRVGPYPDPDHEPEQLRQQLQALYAAAGKYEGYESVGFKPLTPRYQVIYLLAYFEKLPVLFVVGFYQSAGDWRPQTLSFTTNFHPLLDTLPMQRP